ncbi:MAG: tRNA (guanosine(46)-N7)-methyltransferase TrmB [Pseudomonadota bacterium]|nr:tRNA (guanosine(46)-N7)-methyltransferase TrmB [Pseudomonadota bacterium]
MESIKSYVIRRGRMTAGQRNAMNRLWPIYGIEDLDIEINLQKVFQRSGSLTVEIGFGNGENITYSAMQNTNTNFLGIEVYDPGIGHCMLEAERLCLDNLRIIKSNAVEVFRKNLPNNSIDCVNLFFPDPWHKKRHNKRRLVQTEFISLILDKLKTQGVFHVVTDWPNYAEHIEFLMKANSGFRLLKEIPMERITSKFDRRGAKLGHKNWERAWEKII